jgi:hypothetical protein
MVSALIPASDMPNFVPAGVNGMAVNGVNGLDGRNSPARPRSPTGGKV